MSESTTETPESTAGGSMMPAPPAVETPRSSSSSGWKLPDGIEDHLENGLLKAAAGVAVGGVLGVILFRSGKGWRSAAVASGLGAAVGSTYSRVNGMSNLPAQPSSSIQTFSTTNPPSSQEEEK